MKIVKQCYVHNINETLKELEIKLHEQEMFYRKQIKDLDSEMKRKSHGRTIR